MIVLSVDPLPKIDGFDDLLALWNSKREDGRIPPRAAFHPDDFAAWPGGIALSEWEEGDCRFRELGSRFVDLLGRDMTGELLCASLAPELVEPSKRHFAELRYGVQIGHTTGYVPVPGRESTPFNVLDLPLLDGQGEVGFFLHGLVVG